MLRPEWTTPAANELESAQGYYEQHNPLAAEALARRIDSAVRQLCEQPLTGRAGLREGTREWVVQRTPYVLVYRAADGVLQILHVWCAGQDWTNYEL